MRVRDATKCGSTTSLPTENPDADSLRRAVRVGKASSWLAVWGVFCGSLLLQNDRLQAQEPAVLQTQLVDAELVVSWMDGYAALPATDPAGGAGEFRPSYLSRVEVRTETDQFDFAQQRYALRAVPKLWYIRRAERDLQRVRRSRLGTLLDEELGEARGDALELLFDLVGAGLELRALDSLQRVQRRLVEVTTRRLVEPDYDVERALDAQEDFAETDLRRADLAGYLTETELPIGLDRLVGTAEMRQRLLQLESAGPSPADRSLKLAQIDAEAALERAENLQLIDFLQVDYRGDRNELPQQVSVGASLRLPQRLRTIRDLDELAIERAEATYEVELERAERIRNLSSDIAEMRRAFASFDRLQEQATVRTSQRERLRKAYLKSQLTRPEAVLRLERRSLRDQLDLLATESKLRERYARLIADYVALDADGVRRWVLL